MSEQGQRTLQSVDRAIAVLELLSSEPDGLGLGEMAGRLGLKPQTLQSLVRTLQAHGMVSQLRRGGQYVLGPGVHALSRRWLDQCDKGALAREVVVGLAGRIGESVLLAELRHGHLFALIEVTARQALSVSQHAMRDSPLHLMATGKLLLSYLPEEEKEALLARLDLSPRTPHTVTDRDVLRQQLREAREAGYVITDEQSAIGIVAVAVPVWDGGGQVAGLGVAMPKARYEQQEVDEIVSELRRAAREVEASWGCSPTSR